MKKHIPNLVTLLNLLCGSIAAIYAVSGELIIATVFVFMGIFFDFFDGLLARKLKVQSALGLQLDSLADMVTSGLVPGIVMFQLLQLASHNGWGTQDLMDGLHGDALGYVPFLGLLITLGSAYRLANFNISTEQSDAFIGVPTPANTLLILSLPLILEYQNSDLINSIILNQWFLIGLTLVSCYLMNANIKLLALKFKNFNFKDNAARYLLIILAVVLLVVFKVAAIPLIFISYIIISILNK